MVILSKPASVTSSFFLSESTQLQDKYENLGNCIQELHERSLGESYSLLLGRAIYDEALNGVRDSILNGKSLVKVELLLSPKPLAFHLIYPEFEKDRTVISIHLFEYSITKVIFNKLKVSNLPDFCYLEDLKKRISLGAMSVVEAKANQWKEFDI